MIVDATADVIVNATADVIVDDNVDVIIGVRSMAESMTWSTL